MCINQRYVFNKYTGDKVLVKCGKCKACLQEKADKLTTRINNHIGSDLDKICIFSSLTYDERFIPYVLKQNFENKNDDELFIYRDWRVRRFKDNVLFSDYTHCPILLGKVSRFDEDTGENLTFDCSFPENLWKKGRGFRKDRFGVVFYKDIQDFCKRLRINLQREYGKGTIPIEVFCTSEYGETHFRPHFHILVFTRRDCYDRVVTAICKSWLFSSYDDIQRNTSIARNAAAYVSSYVNCPADIPKVLTKVFRQKHSFSRSVGFNNDWCRLDKILEKVSTGTLTYGRRTSVNGVPAIFDVPIPKYVISRYFPYIKGLAKLPTDALALCLREPENYIGYHKHKIIYSNYCDIGDYHDTHDNVVRLRNAQQRYIGLTGGTSYDFAIDYIRTWNCYRNTLYKLLVTGDTPVAEQFDNIVELFKGNIRNDSLTHYLKGKRVFEDFNEFPTVVQRTKKSYDKYVKHVKKSKVNNYIYSNCLNKNL